MVRQWLFKAAKTGGLLLGGLLLMVGLIDALLYATAIRPVAANNELLPVFDKERFELVGRYAIKDAGRRLFLVRDSQTGACYILMDHAGGMEHVPPETCQP